MVGQPERRRRSALGIGEARWKRVRALLLALAIGFNVLGAYPTPGNVTEEKLREGTGRKELERWVEWLESLGIDAEPDDVARRYVKFARLLDDTKALLMAPAMPWIDLTGTQQGWRLFSLPNEHPHVLRITGERRGKKRILYETWSDRRTLFGDVLEYRRVRALYNPSSQGTPNTYDAFARNLAERIFEHEPELDRVTVSLIQRHTTLPGEPKNRRREERFVVSIPRQP